MQADMHTGTCVKLVLRLGPSVSRLNTTVKICEQTERCHANVVLSASSRYLSKVH
jgi:hypothetical protein